ncbi:hypothetical protein DYQ86_26085 [Acidobacteria bacterium AB60]|nr:hypothetical protein DYQ86_26085 [Acidobacteria bacterium AB60]
MARSLWQAVQSLHPFTSFLTASNLAAIAENIPSRQATAIMTQVCRWGSRRSAGEETGGGMNISKVSQTIVMALAACAASAAWAGDVHGKITAQGLRSAENIAVYIDSIPGKTFPAPAEHAQMNQTHLAFVPRVLVVQQGATVDFKNNDNVGHNVYWPAISHNKKMAHNLGTWPMGQSKAFTFTDAGDVPLLCNVHPEMAGYIFVVPTPYFAVTDKDGNFVIKNVPAGQYTVKTSSEGGKPASQAVTVGAGAVNVSLTVTK